MRVFIDTFQAIKALIDAVSAKLGTNTELWGGATKTLLAYANAAYQHIHMPGKVWPDDCTSVTAVTSASANTFGDFVEVVGTDEIAAAFDCHWVTITIMSEFDVFIVEFHIISDGGSPVSETFLTAFSVARDNTFEQAWQVFVQMPPIPGGSRVGARAKRASAGTGNVGFNIHYHEYE